MTDTKPFNCLLKCSAPDFSWDQFKSFNKEKILIFVFLEFKLFIEKNISFVFLPSKLQYWKQIILKKEQVINGNLDQV